MRIVLKKKCGARRGGTVFLVVVFASACDDSDFMPVFRSKCYPYLTHVEWGIDVTFSLQCGILVQSPSFRAMS